MREKVWRRAGKFHQVGIVVGDVLASIGELAEILGIPEDAWTIVDQRSLGYSYRETGEDEARVTGRYARANSGATVYQLIEVAGPTSIWSRAREAGRPVFAVGHSVDDVHASLREMEAGGAHRIAIGTVIEHSKRFDYAFVELPTSGLVVELMGPAKS